MKFSDLQIKPNLLEAIDSLGFSKMTKIQGKALPHILNKKDVIGEASTGSGKTIAFSLGLLNKLNSEDRRPQSLVLCPTRELANQVAVEIRKLARRTENVKVVTLTGGTPFGPQAASLDHGSNCIVGTPGRVMDHLTKRTLDLRQVKTLVLDEADRMLEMGFSEALEKIVSFVPRDRQTLLFSATFEDNVKETAKKFLKKPTHVKIEEEKPSIDELFYEVIEEKKELQLASLIESYLPNSTVIFCNTKQKCQEVSDFLEGKGFSCGSLHGDLEQKDRDDVLMLFANKSLSVLVATDVAARGLDVKDLDLVVNFDLSKQPEVHTHRIGRTGRAGKKGKALSLFSKREERKVKQLEEYSGISYQKKQASSVKSIGPKTFLKAPMVTICIHGGKKHKLRPMDILGTLTNSSDIKGADVGKINLFDYYSCVAICKEQVGKAFKHLQVTPIKKRLFKVRLMEKI